jgi:serine/threonine-protein kinase HipA
LVSVAQYPRIDHDLAMAYGDAFSLDEVEAFQLADFAKRCKVDRRLLKREATRLAKLATVHASTQALADDYVDQERAFAGHLRDFVIGQARRLATLAGDASRIKDEYL